MKATEAGGVMSAISALRTIVGVLSVAAVLSATAARAADVTVNSSPDVLHDDTTPPNTDHCAVDGVGTCSLRDAITYINGQGAGPHKITFSGVDRITLSTSLGSLPVVTATQVTIDGTGGSTGRVEVGGGGLSGSNNGLHMASADCLVKAMVLNGFSNEGLVIEPPGIGCRVQDNYVGTDVTGFLDKGNGSGGVIVSAPGVRVIDNVISGNGGFGLSIDAFDAIGVILTDNKIGTDVTGLLDLGNDEDGIFIRDADGTTIGGGNVISGNGKNGIRLFGATNITATVISGNFIGMGLGGVIAIPNDESGVFLDGRVDHVSVGPNNVISGNGEHGVLLSGTICENNVVFANIVGLQIGGLIGAGNGGDGIHLERVSNNLIGGPLLPDPSLTRNIIGSNGGAGIRLVSTNTSGNDIQGNYIGTDLFEALDLPNAVGIAIEGSQSNDATTIGGDSDAKANVIAKNTGPGIQIGGGPIDRPGPVLILRNKIYDNGGLGIDLENDGVTPNDPGDADLGSNERQNYPEFALALVSATGGQVLLRGTQDSPPGLATQLQFFRAAPDPSGFGEGKELLLDIPNAGTGNFTFGTGPSAPLVAVVPGTAVTVTATTSEGTSEFSANATFVANQRPIADAGSNQTAIVNVPVTLDGSASNDPDALPDGGTIQDGRFTWVQTMGPAVSLTNPTGASPSFTPSQAGTHVFSLAVNDGLDNSTNGATVTITVLTVGITVTPTSGLVTTEPGGTATFTVVLATVPSDDVTVSLSSSNPGEGTVSPSSLTFTPADALTPRLVTVTGIDDAVADGSVAYAVVTNPAVSSDGSYNGLDPQDVSVTNQDDEVAGITVTATSGLTTTEAGGTATFTVVLDATPTADVTINLSSSDPTEGSVSPAALTFTPANATTPQTVTVTGVDDQTIDGPVAYSIVTAPAASSSAAYDGVDAADVSLTNNDDDTASVLVTPATVVTSESGSTATFTVALATLPSDTVVIALSSSDVGEATVSPATLSFLPATGTTAQTVTVTGADDLLIDGPQPFTIVLGPAASNDGSYNGLDPADVSGTNADDDAPGITLGPLSGLMTTEAGGTATFTVVLNTVPTADVTVALSSSDTGEGTVLPAILTFTPANATTPQTVTVTGVDDAVVDGNVAYTIVTAPAQSTDGDYDGLDPADVSVLNNDDDVVGITVNPTSGLLTTEAGGTATFTVVLNTIPADAVTVTLSSSSPSEGTVSPSTLTFTPADALTPRLVTVTGVDDAVTDGDAAYTIVTDPATSNDASYDGLDPGDVSATNADDDVPSIVVTPTAGLLTTEAGGTATFTVVLQTVPTDDVIVTFVSSNPSEGVAPAAILFTPATALTPRTLTVIGLDDAVGDGNVPYTVLTAAASNDPVYDAIDPADVSVTNLDDDTLDLAVTKDDGRTSVVGGRTVTYTIAVTNTGPPTAAGATVVDNPPVQLTGVTWTCAASPGASCTASGSGAISDTVTIPAGGLLTYELSGTVVANAADVTNTATVTPPAALADNTPGNNASTDTDTVVGPGIKDDFDADGHSDLILYNTSTGQVDIWLMNGIGIGTSGTAGTMADLNWQIAAAGDFDGDGRADILWHNAATGDALVWFMNGTMMAGQAPVGAFPDLNWKVGASGDFDADGKFDVAWRNGATGEVYLWLMDGLTIASQGSVGTSGIPIVAVGDYDGDGLWDLLFRPTGGGGATVWFLNGLTLVGQSPTSLTLADPNFQAIGYGDHNGDLRADVLWHNMVTGAKVMWLMNGASVQSGPPGGALRAHPEAVGTGDYDGDGRADIAWQNRSTARVFVWLMNGLAVTSQGLTGLLPGPGTVWKVVRIK